MILSIIFFAVNSITEAQVVKGEGAWKKDQGRPRPALELNCEIGGALKP